MAAEESRDWIPMEADPARPNAARVYDFYLGGYHNFAVDREMAERAIRDWPQVPMIIRANRAFLRRAVRYLADAGLRQFLDLGSGIPTVGNVHEVAQRIAPDSRVVYADIDAVAVAHSQLILTGNDRTAAIQADLREPDRVLSDPVVRGMFDLTQPLAVLMVAVLHFVPDEDDPAGIVARYREMTAPGSHLVVSHATSDGSPERAAEHQELYARTPTPMTMRGGRQISELLNGWELVSPGLVRLPSWRPDPDDQDGSHRPEEFAGYAMVGRR